MLYINQGQENTLTLSINQNSRTNFSAYTLNFTHVMSSEVTSYTVLTSDPDVFYENYRYCQITLDLATDNLPYEGQYILNIYGSPTNQHVYNGFCMISGTVENNLFTEYISPNETNENYIYIQD